MSKVKGGKSVYGAAVGMLMLESRFPRIPGDGGHAGTWPFPMLHKVIPGATPDRVVRHDAEGLLDAFIAGARELVRIGADGVVTNCGFLALYQRELADACRVPVAASSLMQVPAVAALLPAGRRVGIVTVSAASLTARHLERAGASPDTPVVGTESGVELSRVLLNDEPELDVDRARRDVVDAAERLVDENDDIGAVVLECTNMMPYSADIAERLRVPVYDFYTFVTWFHAGLRPRRFG